MKVFLVSEFELNTSTYASKIVGNSRCICARLDGNDGHKEEKKFCQLALKPMGKGHSTSPLQKQYMHAKIPWEFM